MMWGPISRKCWILVLSISHTVHGLAWWSWSGKRMAVWGSVLTSGSLITGPLRMHTCCPVLTKHLIAYKALSGSLPLTWSWDTGRSRWMREVYHWLDSQWGHWASMSAKRMPFGLTNTPTTLQRLMETCLGDLNLHWCIIYLYDIVIFSKDLANHLERLDALLWKLKEAGLKLKPSKCELFWWQIVDLGHVISAQGVATDEGKIKAIKNWPNANRHYRAPKFSWIHGILPSVYPQIHAGSWPLHELTLGENAGKKKAAIQWDIRCQCFVTQN